MAKAIKIKIKGTTSSHIDDRLLRLWFEDYIIRELGDLYGCPALYKYRGVDINTRQVIKKVKNKKSRDKKKVVLEREYMVELGGPFEEVGGEENTLGGGKQKIGSGE